MVENFLYGILAILGLGFLVFIHELGHYIVARRKGMKVESFSIGLGRAVFSWEYQGVKWQICWLPFGGAVKIAGMQREGNREPSEIPDGFYGQSPWNRIQVALAGPVVNIAFSFLCFTVLWFVGGRTKPFSDYTHRIGWIDPKSELYADGVRPGDLIDTYAGKSFQGFKDLLIAGVMDQKTIEISGTKFDYRTGRKTPYHLTLPTYDMPYAGKDKLHTIGILSPASYLIYNDPIALPAGSPMALSGIEKNDRIIWVDGEVAFSITQLTSLINESSAFLTVQRGSEIFQTKVPRVLIEELKMGAPFRGEIDDWQHEVQIQGKLQELYFIPYILSPTNQVEGKISFIDETDENRYMRVCQRCSYFQPLQEGDQILAIDGKKISTPYELLTQLQTRRVLIIVDRDPKQLTPIAWSEADAQFDDFGVKNLNQIIASIGTEQQKADLGTLHFLNPVVPKSFIDYPFTAEQREQLNQNEASYRKYLESIQDPEMRKETARQWEKQQKRVILGIALPDRKVIYNPSPLQQFKDVFDDTWRALYGLMSGGLNPKYLAGPVGIIHIVHNSWMVGAKEAFYWLAVISLNLGFLNLLPIPVLDGGHIMFSVWEAITRRPIRARTMERMIIPFVGLLIAFFIYVTYQDIARLFSHFF